MKQILVVQLQADQFYWARRRLAADMRSEPTALEIVKISTVFGRAGVLDSGDLWLGRAFRPFGL